MIRKTLLLFFIPCLMVPFTVTADEVVATSEAHSHGGLVAGRPDSHAPIGVMGDHAHNAGEFMLSYRYMFMDMRENRSGTSSQGRGDVLNAFMVAPLDMTMEMHMFGGMYAPTDEITIMGMIPYLRKSMNHQTRMGAKFHTDTDGLGDIKLSALLRPLKLSGPHSLHFNAGLSLPTGSIDERDDTPAMRNARLPYPMQLGSGTFDLMPGLTYQGQAEKVSWGAQTIETFRIGRNNNGYRLGDQYSLTAWGAYRFLSWLSGSLRVEALKWGNIRGAFRSLNPMMVPTADPDRRAGERIDLLFGVNIWVPDGTLKGNRIALEAGFPVYEKLDGPQLSTSWRMTVGWQFSW